MKLKNILNEKYLGFGNQGRQRMTPPTYTNLQEVLEVDINDNLKTGTTVINAYETYPRETEQFARAEGGKYKILVDAIKDIKAKGEPSAIDFDYFVGWFKPHILEYINYLNRHTSGE